MLTRFARGATAIDYRYDRFGRTLLDGELAYGYDANGNPTSLLDPDGYFPSSITLAAVVRSGSQPETNRKLLPAKP